jgi:hypothetical protein
MDRLRRSAGERFLERIRTRWTSGALRARQLAKKLIGRGVDEARVMLGWAPGGDAPFLIEASTTQGGVSLQVPRQELPPEEWFRIEAIVRDLELTERDWAANLLAGYFSPTGCSLGAVKES